MENLTAKQKATNVKQWLRALRSGKYKKGTGALKVKGNKYCCLGVAGVECGAIPKRSKPTDENSYYEQVGNWLGLRGSCGEFDGYIMVKDNEEGSLSTVNDNTFKEDKSFRNVAAFIVKHKRRIFEPAVYRALRMRRAPKTEPTNSATA